MGMHISGKTHTPNIYSPKQALSRYFKQLTDLKEDIDSNTVVVKDFNTAFSFLNQSNRIKLNKEILALKEDMENMGLEDSKKSRLLLCL